MGFPIITRRILERIPNVVLKTPFARAIVRKAGVRLPAQDEGAAGSLPVPILSLEGTKGGCSAALQTLINRWRSQPEGTTERSVALGDLVNYIEDSIGQTLEEAYPAEWAQAEDGENPTFTVEVGSDTVSITLGLCEVGTVPEGAGYRVPLGGKFDFDLEPRLTCNPENPRTTASYGPSSGLGTEWVACHICEGETFLIHPFEEGLSGLGVYDQKGARSTLHVSQPFLVVPESPSEEDPIRIEFPGGWQYAYPKMAHMTTDQRFGADFYHLKFVMQGPAIFFGILFRPDFGGSGSGVPLDEWAFNNDDLLPGFEDISLTIGPNHPLYAAASYDAGTVGPTYEDLIATHAEGVDSLNTSSYTHELDIFATGWVCFYWYHFLPTNYWNHTGADQAPGFLYDDVFLHSDFTDAGIVPDAQQISNGILSGFHWENGYSDPSDGQTDYRNSLAAFETVGGQVLFEEADEFHVRDFVVERGPWVRVEPGSEQPLYDVCIQDIRCVTPGPP